MTQDEIIRLAREAGLAQWHESIKQHGYMFAKPDRLKHFAELVAAAEREACAKAVEDMVHGNVKTCAAAIRARGNA